jgi:hypothetical protein
MLVEDHKSVIYPLDDVVRSHCHIRIGWNRRDRITWMAFAQAFPLPESLCCGRRGSGSLEDWIGNVARTWPAVRAVQGNLLGRSGWTRRR